MVIKEEQLDVPPGFSPKPETRYGGDAVTSSSSAAAFRGGNQLDGPGPIKSAPNLIENRVKRETGSLEFPATKSSHFRAGAAKSMGRVHCQIS